MKMSLIKYNFELESTNSEYSLHEVYKHGCM
jgi:hypothetical protein